MSELDDLYKLIEESENKAKKSVKKKHSNSVDRFVSDLNITTGLDKIPTFVIYYHYKKLWKETTTMPKVNKIVFFRAFNKLFTQYRTGKQRYYLLDQESFDISREGIIEAREYNKRENVRIKKKKEKRKMGESKERKEPKA